MATGAEIYYPRNRNSGLVIGPARHNLGRRLARLGLSGLGDNGQQLQLSGTPDQIAAMLAANMNLPAQLPAVAVTPDYETLVGAGNLIIASVPAVAQVTNASAPFVQGTTHSATDFPNPLSAMPALPSIQPQIMQSLEIANMLAGFPLAGGPRSITGRNRMTRLGTLGQSGAPDLNATETKIITTAAGATASALLIGTSIGAFAGPIGAAVGAIVGIVVGLFHHKYVSPPTTQAQIQAAQNLISSYNGIAGHCIGRAYPQSTMQDLTMALCINADVAYNNAGGCGNQAGIANSWNEQLARLNLFFTAMQNAPIGATITLRDIPSLPGHGSTNMNVTYQFPNPGTQAPNYILGPYYSQYFYTMCNIFQDEANCTGWQLTAPTPQYHCDLIDWYRSQHPQWDIPAGTVDAAVEYPTVSLAPGQVNEPTATATVPALSPPAVGISPSTVGASLTETGGPGGTITGATETGGAIIQVPPPAPPSALGTSGPVVLTAQGGGIASSLSSATGLSTTSLLLLAAAGLLVLLLAETKPK